MMLYEWAKKWNIPIEAIQEYRALVGIDVPVATDPSAKTEAGATKLIRLEAAHKGVHLWRNNVGATMDENGNFIRYGLANDTAAMNRKIKSSDLIGIRPDGRFICREVKKPGWRYTGTAREKAQLKFIELINSMGGDAAFATGEGTI